VERSLLINTVKSPVSISVHSSHVIISYANKAGLREYLIAIMACV
jgi:hypothetical protein